MYFNLDIWKKKEKRERKKQKGWQAAIIKWSDIFVIEFDWKSFSKSFDLRNDRPTEDGETNLLPDARIIR